MTWSDTLSDNGIMMEEGEAAKALALGISEKTALSGGTTSVDVSGMCNSLFAPIDWGFCDAVDQVISVIAPRFVDDNSSPYSSDIGELISVAGFTTAVYGATNGEVRLRGGGMLFDSKWIEQRKSVLNLFVTAGTPVSDAVFTTTSLNSNTWTVTGSSVTGATTTLPHSLNAIGSTVTPTSYFRGVATYSTSVTLDASKRYYLYLEPVYQRADVMLNGHTVTTLEVYGGTAAQHVFTEERPGLPVVIDLTSVPFSNGGNTLTIKTDNTSTYYNIPFNGLLDVYNVLGGVTLCEAGELCFDPVTFGTRRCHITATSTKVTVKFAVKCNSNRSQAVTANVYASVYAPDDMTTPMNETTAIPVEVNPGETETYTMQIMFGTNISSKKWSLGHGDLFKVKLELLRGNPVAAKDTIEDYFGYRTFSAAKHDSTDEGYGLTLNGSTMSLYGVGYHHWDRVPTTDEMDADWAIISDLKPKMIRFAYFPALHYLLDKCDQAGIAAMIEIPWMHDFHDATWTPGDHESYRNDWRLRYQHNTAANAAAMANEFYNHPSVLFYCMGTGFGVKLYHEWRPTQAHAFIKDELIPAIQAVDDTRLLCIEMADTTAGYGTPVSWTDIGDIILERLNSGWGSGAIGDAVSEANTWNGRNSTVPMAIMDWSYGANPEDHVEWSNASTKPADTGLNNASAYPEEYQAYCVEQYAGSALALKWPVFNLYGTVFDYAASNVSGAGGKSGVMQTGLVTRDRSILKDAYYYLKAMWNSEPMVYVTQKRNMSKESSPVTLRIYTNCEYVKVWSSSLTLIDTIQKTSGSYVVTKSVELEEGNNVFYVTGHATSDGDSTCSDSVTVFYEYTSSTTRIQVFSDSAIVNSGRVNAIVLPDTEPQGITWSSDTPTIATVNSGGTVTVLLDGTATIRATSTNDNTVTKAKAIPCYVRGATDSLYYKAQQYADSSDTGGENGTSYRGVTIVTNGDGTVTLNGTLTSGGDNYFVLWPSHQVGSHINPWGRSLFPVWDIPGNQLVTCEVVGGTITGTPSGDPFTLVPYDKAYTPLNQVALKPLSEPNGSGDVNAKLIANSTLGFASWRLNHTYPGGTVFDNVTIKIQSFKQANSYYNGGLLENFFPVANTLIIHQQFPGSSNTVLCNTLCRNADGSFTETVANPNAGYGCPHRVALVAPNFYIPDSGVPLTGSTVATAGTVLKFTAIMKHWPGNYSKKADNSEWSFVLWYADGTTAARLKWAYGDDGDGVDFTGGTASTTFIAEKTVDCAGWYYNLVSWGGTLNLDASVTFCLKLEEIDPTNVPPSTITVYGSTRIVNTGQLNAVFDPVSANPSVTWSSSNTSVATVDSNGKVTVVADGSCTFTATSTLDNTKSGSVTVACLKVADQNMVANLATAKDANKSVVINGVTVTNNGDGTFALDGTVSSTASTGYILCPLATSSSSAYEIFLPVEISGDALVWLEHLGGTVSAASTLTNEDFEVRVHGASNALLSDYTLNYVEYPESNGESQCKLVTGSTATIRKIVLQSKRPANTVFSNYILRAGVKKLCTAGLLYSGGVIESSLLGLNNYASVERLDFNRLPDGSYYVKINTSNAYWTSSKTSGCFRLTTSIVYQQSSGNLLTGNAIAASGKTYKLTVRMLEALSVASSTANELSFVAKGTGGTELAKLTVLSGGAQTNVLDANGVAEQTFSATEAVDVVYFYFSNVKLSPGVMHFAISLTEVTA